ncbi:MAG TPA: hypothetical protein VM222_07030 [Planctomycetota bacterium]|nr:hypothetical protein [Planctomycetota bacterium]
MNRYAPVALIAVCAALGVALAVQKSSLDDARREVDEMKTRVDRIEAKQKDTAARKVVDELRDEVARVEKKAAAATTAAEAAARRPAPAATAPAAAPATLEEDIQKIVDAKVEEKLQQKGAGKAGGDDRKMPLFDLAKELTLDDATQARVASISNTVKKEIFDILKTPRPDGTNLADEIVTAFTSGDTAGIQKLFGRLFTEKIPGTDTPYVTAVARVQEKANAGLKQTMGPDAFGRYQGMNLKPENIETGFDPWLDYLQQKGK